jgi:oligoendopeptidase F
MNNDAPETAMQPEPVCEGVPEWDLRDLYLSPDDPKIEMDLATVKQLAVRFAERHRGRIAALDGRELAAAIETFEAIWQQLLRVGSFAQLRFAADASDPARARFHQTANERVNEISADLLFFRLEINRLDDEKLNARLSAPEAARYASWIRDVRAFRAHELADDLEKFLHDKSVVAAAAWNRLFDETMAGLKFSVDGRELTSSEVFDRLSDPSTEVRRKAAKSIGRVLGDNIRVFSLITNTLIKDKEIEDRWRGYARPVSYRNLSNQVEDEVVDALVTSVKRAYARISHRYYRIKADWLGVEKLRHWDRNAPLPEREDKRIDWNDARRIVSDAYVDFVPEFGDLVGRFFEGGWIDAKPRPGKDSGAFSHPTVPDVHPYILMSFHGRTRDVMTLAHELGHGIHQLLAAPQGLLMSDTPLTLAETASVFGEMLTFRSMLASETDPRQRRVMLASKIEDMINTVIRQTAFYEFERRLHDERRAGELSAERIGEIWLSVQSESLGPAFQFDDEYAYYWSYIPHFVHSPFYVYAYAFGDCLVNSLYQLYQDGTDDFQGKYVAMLKSGGTLRHKELLAPFGLDAADPEFWQRGLGVVSGFIDELEQEL